MARLTEESKTHNEAAIRAAMERILKGDLPPGGKADLKTLAALADVTRTGFHPKKNRDGTTRPGAYQHLAEEFERRLNELRDAGEIVDPRISQLTEFRTLAISRLAAQHDEIERLRRQVTDDGVVRRLPEATNHIAPFGSCS
ncbi:hypothetical protein ABZ078_38950 [Streptomyces sp. NPDC006385]|uniref:hypothetical protein n=1 Tax=Streptomyces sp. NPDC006385 TaxID=3156761 RepID=UPI0033A98134